MTPPPEPHHLVAQQLLAATLQRHRIGDQLWQEMWNGLAPFDRSAAPVLRHLLSEGFLAPPQFTVLSGRTEIWQTDPSVLTEERPGHAVCCSAGAAGR